MIKINENLWISAPESVELTTNYHIHKECLEAKLASLSENQIELKKELTYKLDNLEVVWHFVFTTPSGKTYDSEGFESEEAALFAAIKNNWGIKR